MEAHCAAAGRRSESVSGKECCGAAEHKAVGASKPYRMRGAFVDVGAEARSGAAIPCAPASVCRKGAPEALCL